MSVSIKSELSLQSLLTKETVQSSSVSPELWWVFLSQEKYIIIVSLYNIYYKAIPEGNSSGYSQTKQNKTKFNSTKN